MALIPRDTETGADLYTPLDRNSFALEFNEEGSTIVKSERFSLHARQILVDENNYLGLFALDTLLKNKINQYRKCGITPKANHPILAFFQVHIFHDDDIRNGDTRGWKYLPDRPDLDKILALLHDEGEEVYGFTKKELKQRMHQFIDNIADYIAEHNEQYPMMPLDVPSDKKIKKMRKDIKGIAKSFDLLTRGYKGQEKKGNYYKYHRDMMSDGRACRIKIIDKACNAATFVYRDQELLSYIPDGLAVSKYRDWVQNQIEKMRDIYFDQIFTIKNHYTSDGSPVKQEGFIFAVAQKHPNSAKFFNVMSKLMKSQLGIYTHDRANEREGHGSPATYQRADEYDLLSFSPRVNLLDIQINRLKEVKKLDADESRDYSVGMFGIKFPNKVFMPRTRSSTPGVAAPR